MNREEAIKILKGAIKKPNTKDGYLGQALTMGIEALENQKTGHWIRKNDICTSRVQIYQYECSNCREINTFQGNYCPNCGAKMEGE